MPLSTGKRQYRRFPSMGSNGPTIRFALAVQTESAEEDSFLWSLADLMTLLLIFFILLYANTLQHPEPPARESCQSFEIDPESSEAQTVSLSDSTMDQPAPAERATDMSPEPVAPHEPANDASEPCAEAFTAFEPAPETFQESITSSALELEVIDAAESLESLDGEMMDDLEESFSNDFYLRWDDKIPVFVLGERITFNIGDAMLLEGSQMALKRIVDIIAAQENYQIIVSGHTDNIAISTPVFPSNWELSAARAASVAKFLVSHGIDPSRLIIQGRSEFDPLATNTSEENRRKNRRVEVSLLQE